MSATRMDDRYFLTNSINDNKKTDMVPFLPWVKENDGMSIVSNDISEAKFWRPWHQGYAFPFLGGIVKGNLKFATTNLTLKASLSNCEVVSNFYVP